MGSIDTLLNLYRVDAQVRALRRRLESAQRNLHAQTRLLETADQQLEELRSRKRQIQATIGNLEGESAGVDQRLEKLRTELNSAVTNKQYSAVLTELNTVKLDRSGLEDRILQEMERIEQLDQQFEAVESQRADRGKVCDAARHELKERQGEVGDRLAELGAERDAAAAEVSGAELAVFNEMADCYDGEAMAPIEEIDRRHREYACGACNMHVPFEQVVLLLGGRDTLV
ncbi:MAG: zinc ribbon domain-containing protein, partial [Planctomycetota bacterium]